MQNNVDKHSSLSLCNFFFTLFGSLSMFCLGGIDLWGADLSQKYHIRVAINLGVTLPALLGLAHNEKDGQQFCQLCSWEMGACSSNWTNEKDGVSRFPVNEPEPGAMSQDGQNSRYSLALAQRWRGCEWSHLILWGVAGLSGLWLVGHRSSSVRRVFNTGFLCAMLCDLQNNMQSVLACHIKPQCTLYYCFFGMVAWCPAHGTLHTATSPRFHRLSHWCSLAFAESSHRSGEVSGFRTSKFQLCPSKRHMFKMAVVKAKDTWGHQMKTHFLFSSISACFIVCIWAHDRKGTFKIQCAVMPDWLRISKMQPIVL